MAGSALKMPTEQVELTATDSYNTEQLKRLLKSDRRITARLGDVIARVVRVGNVGPLRLFPGHKSLRF